MTEKQNMTEWDRQVCKKLDSIWNEYQTGQMKTISTDETLIKAKTIVEEARRKQKIHRSKNYSHSKISYAV